MYYMCGLMNPNRLLYALVYQWVSRRRFDISTKYSISEVLISCFLLYTNIYMCMTIQAKKVIILFYYINKVFIENNIP